MLLEPIGIFGNNLNMGLLVGLSFDLAFKHLWLERSLYKVYKNLIKFGDQKISQLWRMVVEFGKICNFFFFGSRRNLLTNLSRRLHGRI